jgi:hypothetical protein
MMICLRFYGLLVYEVLQVLVIFLMKYFVVAVVGFIMEQIVQSSTFQVKNSKTKNNFLGNTSVFAIYLYFSFAS